MKDRSTANLALGAAAGLAGTALIRGMMAGTKRWLPQTLPPVREDPGHFMVKQAERVLPSHVQDRIPERAEEIAAQALAFGYGLTFGSLYAATRPRGGNVWLEGTALGVATWAAGYLGWLPAAGLTPPVWKHEAKQVAPNILSHVVFGVATVAAFKWAHNYFGRR